MKLFVSSSMNAETRDNFAHVSHEKSRFSTNEINFLFCFVFFTRKLDWNERIQRVIIPVMKRIIMLAHQQQQQSYVKLPSRIVRQHRARRNLSTILNIQIFSPNKITKFLQINTHSISNIIVHQWDKQHRKRHPTHFKLLIQDNRFSLHPVILKRWLWNNFVLVLLDVEFDVLFLLLLSCGK